MFTTTKGSTIPYKTQTTIYSKLFFIAQWLKPPWWRWLPTSLPVVFGKPSRSLSTSSGFLGRKISPMVNESSWDFREVTAYVTCGKKLRIIQLKQQDRIRAGILGWEPPRDPKLNRLTCHDCIQGGATTKQNLLASKLTWWCCLCHHHIKNWMPGDIWQVCISTETQSTGCLSITCLVLDQLFLSMSSLTDCLIFKHS